MLWWCGWFACTGGPSETVVEPDPPQRRCTVDEPEVCVELAHEWRNGIGVPRDAIQAESYLGIACEGGLADACNDAGMMKMVGDVVPEDKEGGFALFTKGCSKDHIGACYNLGLAYANGDGVERDNNQAREYFVFTCERGLSLACDRLEAARQNLMKAARRDLENQ